MESPALVAFRASKELVDRLEQKTNELDSALVDTKKRVGSVRAERQAVRDQLQRDSKNAELQLKELRAKLRQCDPELAAQIDAVQDTLDSARTIAASRLNKLRAEAHELREPERLIADELTGVRQELYRAQVEMNAAMNRMAMELSPTSASFAPPFLHLPK
tara:strand:+ start:61 stop:543 length:483 start_codon:yes stop_codon:yes gene_type:complete